jgi:hypothetical protein
MILVGNLLPGWFQRAAETAIGFVIVYLGVRLLVRSRRGELRLHADSARTRRGAFAIGLLHGLGGSAGVGVLVLASARSTVLAVASLALLAVFTAVSMSAMSSGFGLVLASRPGRASLAAIAPAMGGASLLFGGWYATAAWSLAPYPF